jgi:hypothetical protein
MIAVTMLPVSRGVTEKVANCTTKRKVENNSWERVSSVEIQECEKYVRNERSYLNGGLA